MPYLVGVVGLVFFWVLYRTFCGKWDLLKLAEGDDGLPSSSMFQFLLWTAVALFAYIAIYTARAQQGEYGALAEVPANLLILMGISSGSMVISKGITVYQLSRGSAAKKHRTPKGNRLKYFITDDLGEPVLNKVQMIAWTLVAIGIYLFLVTRQVSGAELPTLPDVDESLLVLMGISQGTYLGKRLVSSTTPTLRSLDKATAKPGDTLVLTGTNLGDEQEVSMVKINDLYPSKIEKWSNESITLDLPQGIAAGPYSISVMMGGKESTRLTLTVV